MAQSLQKHHRFFRELVQKSLGYTYAIGLAYISKTKVARKKSKTIRGDILATLLFKIFLRYMPNKL